ncbi:MAG TPA: aminoglycoside phosphotransferase family protein [Pyrinomonadaceae bacterium]|nr:aminoglycoside phosphotransferase family protein [Pyrinomonadaceae bacterium]
MDRANTVLEKDAIRIVSDVSGRGIRHVQAILRGFMTFKYLVETVDDARFIVRFYPSGREEVLNSEPDLLAHCRRSGLPVPVVSADARTGPKATLAYVVYRMIEGASLSEALPGLTPEQASVLASELATCLLELRRIELHGYGELITGETAADTSWRAFVKRSFETGIDSLQQSRLIDSSSLLRLREFLNTTSYDVDSQSCQLVWGDISFANIIVDSTGHLAGLIDFESSLSGDPLATLGYCFACHGNHPFWETLIQRWPQPLDDTERERILFYALLRGLRLAPYLDRPLPTGRPRDPLFEIFPGFELAIETLTTLHT